MLWVIGPQAGHIWGDQKVGQLGTLFLQATPDDASTGPRWVLHFVYTSTVMPNGEQLSNLQTYLAEIIFLNW